MDPQAAVENHVRRFFAGHPVRVLDDTPPGVRILEAGPGPRGGCWSYVTAGCWAAAGDDGHGLEFVMTSRHAEPRVAELLGLVAGYHADHHLDHWHSLPVGEPWLPGSACDHLLVSLPYLHGPDLEECELPGGHARILWLLPITAAERAYRAEHGTEALEELFDEAAIDPTDPHRASVV